MWLSDEKKLFSVTKVTTLRKVGVRLCFCHDLPRDCVLFVIILYIYIARVSDLRSSPSNMAHFGKRQLLFDDCLKTAEIL